MLYRVWINYHETRTIEVDAENETEARLIAWEAKDIAHVEYATADIDVENLEEK